MEERILELMTAFKGLNNSDMLEGCSQSEFNTLVTIEQIEAEKVNVNKIAESLKVSMPAVSKTLKNLESKKLIKRKIDVFCRRNTFVELTAKGKKVLEKNIKQIRTCYPPRNRSCMGQRSTGCCRKHLWIYNFSSKRKTNKFRIYSNDC